jgi:hypothetical protein
MKIKLTKGYTALVDKADYGRVKQHGWVALVTQRGNAYANATVWGKNIYLHHFILGSTPTSRFRVAHLNGNPLDCRKKNLKVVRKFLMPKGAKRNKAGARGVRRDPKASNGWEARIHVEGKSYYLGYFTSRADAIRARKAAEDQAMKGQPIISQLSLNGLRGRARCAKGRRKSLSNQGL